MKVHRLKNNLLETLNTRRDAGRSIGLVPTMGALHRGHISLVKEAASQNEVVVVSIFVNPTQFNNPSDLDKYPRTMEADMDMLTDVDTDIIIFAPSSEELYNGNVVSKSYDFGGLEYEMEGKHRPGHFNGVGTVLSILFRAVNPDKAYFGEKDFQQLQVVRKLVEIEGFDLEIVGCPILREENGLAMSSRNKRLTSEERQAAGVIYSSLKEIKRSFSHNSISKLQKQVEEVFEKHPLLRLEYFEIANENTLKPALRKHKKNHYRAFIAVFAGEVRLIDNLGLN